MKTPTKNNLLIALAYSLTLAAGMYLGYRFLKDQGFAVTSRLADNTEVADKRGQIMEIIDKNYVDDVNSESLKNLPIDSMLHQLDPHSVYLPPLQAHELAENLQGNFGGIGVHYYVLNDTLLVTGVVKSGPAEEAGLRLGDRILRIDSVQVSGKSLPREKMIGRIRGKMGTSVSLLVKRPNNIQPIQFLISRKRVEVSSIDAGYMLNNDVGYIRISKFGVNTERDFGKRLRELKSKGMKKLVLDLRDNEGGYLAAATSLANQLFPEKKLIVYTEGKNDPRTDYLTLGGGEFENGKLVVLINEQSASAAEIIAGAVQDLERGVIIGRRSFGKGLVQEQFAFEDGSALNLTVARYYTPLGRSIQKSYKEGYKAYQEELEERMSDGELTSNNVSKRSIDSTQVVFTTHSGKRLYGGGGIEPDVFVRLDTAGYTPFYNALINKQVLFDYVYEVLVNRYAAPYLEKNMQDFTVSEADFKDLLNYAKNKKLKVDPKQVTASKALIQSDLKSLLYKYHLGDQGFFKAQNLSDPMIRQAINSLAK